MKKIKLVILGVVFALFVCVSGVACFYGVNMGLEIEVNYQERRLSPI